MSLGVLAWSKCLEPMSVEVLVSLPVILSVDLLDLMGSICHPLLADLTESQLSKEIDDDVQRGL